MPRGVTEQPLASPGQLPPPCAPEHTLLQALRGAHGHECCPRPMLCQRRRNATTNQAGMASLHGLTSVLDRQNRRSSRWKVKYAVRAAPGHGHRRAQSQGWGWDVRPRASLSGPRSAPQARDHFMLDCGGLSHIDLSPWVVPELGHLRGPSSSGWALCWHQCGFHSSIPCGAHCCCLSGCDPARWGPRDIVFHTPPRSRPCRRLGSSHPSTLPAPRRCCSQRGTFPPHRELVESLPVH